jgi:hypothetical protein
LRRNPSTAAALQPGVISGVAAMPIIDIYDGEPWSEMDVKDLCIQLEQEFSIEEIARFLCRSGTVHEVRRKAEELGLIEAAQN